jgi:hypothetical protein
MDDVRELLGEIDRCKRQLTETRRKFVLSGGTKAAYNECRVGRHLHTELVTLEAELRQVADRLHEFRLTHEHAPVGQASQ